MLSVRNTESCPVPLCARGADHLEGYCYSNIRSLRASAQHIEHLGSAHSDAKVALLEAAPPRKTAGDAPQKLDLSLDCSVIGADHQLCHVEQAFRMSKRDLEARPVFANQRELIEAHVHIGVAALSVAQQLEAITG
jgi:hypothetical protein